MEFKKELNVYHRVQGIMSELSFIVTEDKKMNGQYHFVSHNAVTSKLHPLMVKWGLIVIPTVVEHHIDGNRMEMVVEARFQNVDKLEDFFVTRAVGLGMGNDDKLSGKAYSYAMKMLYLKVFCLESGEVDNEMDTTTTHKPASPEETKARGASYRKQLQAGTVSSQKTNSNEDLI